MGAAHDQMTQNLAHLECENAQQLQQYQEIFLGKNAKNIQKIYVKKNIITDYKESMINYSYA